MMTLEFHPLAVPGFLSVDHIRRGGKDLRRYVADVPDGVMRVMVAREPAGKKAALIWHVSVTIAASGDIGVPPLRAPTADELNACKNLLPGVEFEEQRGNPLARHLWEIQR